MACLIRFGLLHGLGFASALSDVGLPQHNIPMALFLFNNWSGARAIELCNDGAAFAWMIKLSRFRFPKWSFPIPAYMLGTVAMYWFIERIWQVI